MSVEDFPEEDLPFEGDNTDFGMEEVALTGLSIGWLATAMLAHRFHNSLAEYPCISVSIYYYGRLSIQLMHLSR